MKQMNIFLHAERIRILTENEEKTATTKHGSVEIKKQQHLMRRSACTCS